MNTMKDLGEWFKEAVVDAMVGLLLPCMFTFSLYACKGDKLSIIIVISAYFLIFYSLAQKSFSEMKSSFLSWLAGNILYLLIITISESVAL